MYFDSAHGTTNQAHLNLCRICVCRVSYKPCCHIQGRGFGLVDTPALTLAPPRVEVSIMDRKLPGYPTQGVYKPASSRSRLKWPSLLLYIRSLAASRVVGSSRASTRRCPDQRRGLQRQSHMDLDLGTVYQSDQVFTNQRRDASGLCPARIFQRIAGRYHGRRASSLPGGDGTMRSNVATPGGTWPRTSTRLSVRLGPLHFFADRTFIHDEQYVICATFSSS